MLFSGKSVRSLNKILKISGAAKKIRLAVKVDDISKELIISLGFNYPVNLGDYLIPSVIGKFTDFNANGSVNIRKDLPMEPESVMFYGASRDWHGGIHHGFRTRTVEKYPREYIPAPSETLEIISIHGHLFVSSSELNFDDINEIRNIHVINLMLECFSKFQLLDISTEEIIGPKLKRLQWDILPSGEYPWEKAKTFISKVTDHFIEKDKKVIEHRMQIISHRNPDFLAIGRAGFSGYFVYGFKNKNVYVLESVHLDNATYVFSSDWVELSQLTKGEIIKGNLQHKRIIHNDKWRIEVGRAIDGK